MMAHLPTGPEILDAIPIIISLIVIEGLLSVDNALAIAAMASHLPGRQKYHALKLGLVGAYLFRGGALAFAHLIIENPWLKVIGAAYLVHLMAIHFASDGVDENDSDEAKAGAARKGLSFWSTVVSIEIMDLSLSVDNVVAAVAMSPKLWVVCTGVFIGIVALRFVAGLALQMIAAFPILTDTAFLLIGYVGLILVAELTLNLHVTAFQKFVGIAILVALSMIYSRAPAVRTTLAPILKVGRIPLRVYAAISGPIFGLLSWPWHTAARLIRRKRSSPKVENIEREN